MPSNSKKCCKSCNDHLGISALQALARKGGDCLVRLCVATTPFGDDAPNLEVREFSTGSIPGNEIILSLPRGYSVLWNRCDPDAVAKPFCQTWYRVCADGYIVDRFLVPLGDGRFRVDTVFDGPANIRAAPDVQGLDIGRIPDGYIVQGLGDPLVENDGFLWRHVRVCGWAFAGLLGDCNCVNAANGVGQG